MGLFSNRVERRNLKPGDHIYTWRKLLIYADHGIYVGDNEVIHFTKTRKGHGVISSSLDSFLAGGNLYRYEYSVSLALFLAKMRGGTCTLAASDEDDVVIHRAKYLCENGFRCYKNNCEDFAIYCKTGLPVVDQKSMCKSGQATSLNSDLTWDQVVIHKICYHASAYATSKVLESELVKALGSRLVAVVLGSGPFTIIVSCLVVGILGTVIYCVIRYRNDIGKRKDVNKVPLEDL